MLTCKWRRVWLCVRARERAIVNKNFKALLLLLHHPISLDQAPPPSLHSLHSTPLPSPLLDVSSMYLGDLSCRCTVLVWDCICVCARTGPRRLTDWPHPTPPPAHPPVPCVCTRRLLWLFLLGHCCFVTLLFLFCLFVRFFFCLFCFFSLRVQTWWIETKKTCRWRPPPTTTTPLSTLPCH